MSGETNHPPGDGGAPQLVDPVKQELLWPSIFNLIKVIAKQNALSDDVRSLIKNYLSAPEPLVVLTSVTLLHTVSMNVSVAVRTSLAGIKRIEKVLSKPQHPVIAQALGQLLRDWCYLFSEEELGARALALISLPRHRQYQELEPSHASQSALEEVLLGMPAVAPRRGHDYTTMLTGLADAWFYNNSPKKQGGNQGGSSGNGGSVNSGSGGGEGPEGRSGVSHSRGLHPSRRSAIHPEKVPEAVVGMQEAAVELQLAAARCGQLLKARLHRSSSSSGGVNGRAAASDAELRGAVDAGYEAAQRCSDWRCQVQEWSQKLQDDGAVASLLSTVDVLNAALQAWQTFTTTELPKLASNSSSAAAAAAAAPQPAAQAPAVRAAADPLPSPPAVASPSKPDGQSCWDGTELFSKRVAGGSNSRSQQAAAAAVAAALPPSPSTAAQQVAAKSASASRCPDMLIDLLDDVSLFSNSSQHSSSMGGGPAFEAPHAAVNAQLDAMFASLAAHRPCCSRCSGPPLGTVKAAVASFVQGLVQQHRDEVSQIKARSIQKLKELMAKQPPPAAGAGSTTVARSNSASYAVGSGPSGAFSSLPAAQQAGPAALSMHASSTDHAQLLGMGDAMPHAYTQQQVSSYSFAGASSQSTATVSLLDL